MNDQDIKIIIQNLSSDPSFVDWVRSDFSIDNEIWSDFIDQHIAYADDINYEIALVRNLGFKPISKINTEKLWANIQSQIERKTGTKSMPFRRIYPLSRKMTIAVSMVASLIVMLVFLWNIDFNAKRVEAEMGQDVIHLLPDGSEVLVDAGSEITYNSKDYLGRREVRLTGRAFFEVKKGATFNVLSDQGAVTVLGTSFSVLAQDSTFEVVCYTGKVKMELKNGKSYIMVPGKKCVYQQGGIFCEEQVIGDDDWTDGVYTYNDVSLREVIKDLEVQFNITIKVADEALQKKYSGYFDQRILEKALQSVFWPLEMKYHIDKDNIYVQE